MAEHVKELTRKVRDLESRIEELDNDFPDLELLGLSDDEGGLLTDG